MIGTTAPKLSGQPAGAAAINVAAAIARLIGVLRHSSPESYAADERGI